MIARLAICRPESIIQFLDRKKISQIFMDILADQNIAPCSQVIMKKNSRILHKNIVLLIIALLLCFLILYGRCSSTNSTMNEFERFVTFSRYMNNNKQ